MKLIIAIIQDEDAGEVISHLNEAEIQVTRLATKEAFTSNNAAKTVPVSQSAAGMVSKVATTKSCCQ